MAVRHIVAITGSALWPARSRLGEAVRESVRGDRRGAAHRSFPVGRPCARCRCRTGRARAVPWPGEVHELRRTIGVRGRPDGARGAVPAPRRMDRGAKPARRPGGADRDPGGRAVGRADLRGVDGRAAAGQKPRDAGDAVPLAAAPPHRAHLSVEPSAIGRRSRNPDGSVRRGRVRRARPRAVPGSILRPVVLVELHRQRVPDPLAAGVRARAHRRGAVVRLWPPFPPPRSSQCA